MSARNPFNGEWRTVFQMGEEAQLMTEAYLPLRVKPGFFFNPQLFWERLTFDRFANGNLVAEDRVNRYGLRVSAGRELGTWGELRLGLERSKSNTRVGVGVPFLGVQADNDGELFTQFAWDTLDNTRFPSQGISGRLWWVSSRNSLGADVEFDQVLFDTLMAKTWHDNTFLFGARYGTTMDGVAPLQNLFRLGGLFRLPGFRQDELSGQQSALIRVGYLRRIFDRTLFPIYIGGSLQLGNVWEKTSDISASTALTAGSVFLGLDTLFGPIYLGYGQAEGGNESLYFTIGRSFSELR